MFEYKVADVQPDTLESELNQLATEDWQMTGVVHNQVVFMRPVKEVKKKNGSGNPS